METMTCPNGHEYDSKLFDSCPLCRMNEMQSQPFSTMIPGAAFPAPPPVRTIDGGEFDNGAAIFDRFDQADDDRVTESPETGGSPFSTVIGAPPNAAIPAPPPVKTIDQPEPLAAHGSPSASAAGQGSSVFDRFDREEKSKPDDRGGEAFKTVIGMPVAEMPSAPPVRTIDQPEPLAAQGGSVFDKFDLENKGNAGGHEDGAFRTMFGMPANDQPYAPPPVRTTDQSAPSEAAPPPPVRSMKPMPGQHIPAPVQPKVKPAVPKAPPQSQPPFAGAQGSMGQMPPFNNMPAQGNQSMPPAPGVPAAGAAPVNAAPQQQMPLPCGCLIVADGPVKGLMFILHAGENVIGRSGKGKFFDIDLKFNKKIHRAPQAVITYDPDANSYTVRQHKEGRNHVSLNGSADPVITPAVLNSYDVLTIEKTPMVFIGFCSERFSWKNFQPTVMK